MEWSLAGVLCLNGVGISSPLGDFAADASVFSERIGLEGAEWGSGDVTHRLLSRFALSFGIFVFMAITVKRH